jgi:hypothetical protein
VLKYADMAATAMLSIPFINPAQ